MHLTCIPRHRLELRLSDYATFVRDLLWTSDYARSLGDFESSFADRIGCRNAIAVPSGRLGLKLLLGRLNLAPGNEAIIPAFNLHAVIEQFVALGLTPRLCDIESRDLNINAATAERLITPRTRILLATHMFGHAADLTALGKLAERRNLILLEDCAHAFGTRWNGRSVGTFGKAAIFSFSVLKLVTTFGGGMVTTNDDALAAAIREDLTWHTRPCSLVGAAKRIAVGVALDFGTRRWPFTVAAWPALRLARGLRPDFQKRIMTEIPPNVAAASDSMGGHARTHKPRVPSALHASQLKLGVRQLVRSGEFIRRRRQIDAWLDREWKDTPSISPLRSRTGSQPNGLYYGLLCDRPNELAEYLFANGVDAETNEYRNCADLAAYRPFAADCPVARIVESRIVRLPNHPGLSHEDVRRIGRLVRRFYATCRSGEIIATAERKTAAAALTSKVFARPRSETAPIAEETSAPTAD